MSRLRIVIPALLASVAVGLNGAPRSPSTLDRYSFFVTPPKAVAALSTASITTKTTTTPTHRRTPIYCRLGGDGIFSLLSIQPLPFTTTDWRGGSTTTSPFKHRSRKPMPSMMRDGNYQYQPPSTPMEVGSRGTLPGAFGHHVVAAAAGDKEESKKKRVLILMSDTGGGHRASALALETALEELYPGKIECSIVDIWTDYAPWPYNQFVPGYQYLAKNPLYWKLFWEYGKFPVTKWGTEQTSMIACHDRFKRCIESYSPDMVISVHPLCQDVPLRVLNTLGRGKRTIPFVTVVTDLGGAHPTWFHKDVDICFVPSDPVRILALNNGLKNYQIRQHGLPIRAGFWKESRAQPTLRKELQIADAKTALIVGGGDGIGNIAEITESVADRLSKSQLEQSQVVVICGKNEEVKNKLLSRSWPSNVNVVVKGFVKNMDEFMGASDCIITKAGPGTIAEASTRGLPCMLFNFLPGQEEGNVPFVEKAGFGKYSKDPTVIAEEVTSWLEDDERLAELSQKAKEAARPHATTDIAGEIGDLLFGDHQIPRRKDVEDKFSFLFKKLGEAPLSV